MPRRFVETVWDYFASPRVAEADLDAALARIRADLPTPVFWMLGKAQSGKTSIIRCLTGNTKAEIGSGFRPCTRTATLYCFPSDDNCLLRFLDTRGLGEVDYDIDEDLKLFEGQAHLILVVMKAADHAQQPVLEALAQIVRRRPHWPVIVAQTSLHELYPTVETRHPQPYPFDREPWPADLPADLVRSLVTQRKMFHREGLQRLSPAFVPVDLTLAEDGFIPADYGLEALYHAIEEALPRGVAQMVLDRQGAREDLRDIHWRTAHPHVVTYSLAAAGAAGVPIPLVDVPLVFAVQAKMMQALASIYNQPFSAARMAEVAGALGVGFAGRLGLRELLKVIPGVGMAATALYAAASTYALGRTLCAYYSHAQAGDVPGPEQFRKLYKEQYSLARQHLREFLRRKDSTKATGS